MIWRRESGANPYHCMCIRTVSPGLAADALATVMDLDFTLQSRVSRDHVQMAMPTLAYAQVTLASTAP